MWLNRHVVASLLAANASLSQGPLTDQQVARVIDRAAKLTDPDVCVGRATAPEFLICIQGPEQRVAVAAAAAKQTHQRLRPADVPTEARAQTWTIVVRPSQPALIDGRPVRTPLAEDLTLRAQGQPELLVRPLRAARFPVAWNNAIGVVLKGQGLTATFDASTLPPGDLDVVIVEEGGTERRYLLARSARARIR
jgi:hypothetical protein